MTLRSSASPSQTTPPPSPGLTSAAALEQVSAAMRATSRAYVAAVLRALHAAGYDDLTAAAATLLESIDPAGSRATVLASRLGVTKQATGQMVDELAARDYVSATPDPSDARARLVRRTRRGEAVLKAGAVVKQNLERKVIAALGAADLARLEADLARIAAIFSADDAPSSGSRRRA